MVQTIALHLLYRDLVKERPDYLAAAFFFVPLWKSIQNFTAIFNKRDAGRVWARKIEKSKIKKDAGRYAPDTGINEVEKLVGGEVHVPPPWQPCVVSPSEP